MNGKKKAPAFASIALGMSLAATACTPEPPPGQIEVSWTLGLGVSCSDLDADIDTITITVVDPVLAKTLQSSTYACSAARGTLSGLPAGIYDVTLDGGKGETFKDPTFTAAVSNVRVESGQLTAMGNVVLEKLPPKEVTGGLKVSWTFSSGLCGANGVSYVQFQVWRDEVYKDHDTRYPCDLPAPGFVHLELKTGTYGLMFQALDPEGNILMSVIKRDVKVEDGKPAVDLTGPNAIVLDSVD
jgi:hypothetical protein